MKTREEYITHIKNKLDEINAKIGEVERKVDSKKLEATSELGGRVDELKEKRKMLDRSIKEIQAASQDSWKTIQDGADNILDETKKTYRKLEERLTAAIR